MNSKALLFIGIFLLIAGIMLRKLSQMDTLGLDLIITGVTLKAIYILLKVKSGEYKPGKELIFLVVGLLLFFMGLHLRNINQNLIRPIYLIVFGITLKIIFIIRFIQIIKSGKKAK